MPSPFPGMDPYLEDPDLWPDVHHELIGGIRSQLSAKLRGKGLVVRVKLRTFLFDQDDPAEDLYLIPDARIVTQSVPSNPLPTATRPTAAGVAVADSVAAGIDVTGQLPRIAQQRFLEIRDPANRQVITVIELVSPSNKAVGSAGRKAYLEKRRDVSISTANWFEVDLLRRGTPMVKYSGVPKTSYRAYADQVTSEGRQQIYWPIHLRESLPTLSVPLRLGEGTVPLNLQSALDLAFANASYEADIDHTKPPKIPLEAVDAKWAEDLLRQPKI